MSTSQYALNLGLLAVVLWANLGTRRVTRSRLLLPLVAVVAAGFAFLGDVPTRGNDVALDVALTAAGAVLGVVAGLLVSVHRRADALVMRAGAAYAALWIAVVGGRIAFAYGAEHGLRHAIATFSRSHLITGADAWTAAFVLMALAMVVARVVVTVIRIARAGRTPAAVPATA